MGLPTSPLLTDFLRVGIANHMPLRVAEEEFRVANVRYLEAMRNLMPAVTWKYSESQGELKENPSVSTDDTKFRRKEYGLEFGIPIFHSGRNYFNFRSAAAQKFVAEENVRKVRGEILFEITRAYYNLIRSQRAVKVRKELSQRSEKIIELARKKKQLGLITQADYLGAESLFNQGYYRLLSDEKDLEIARLKMAGLVNIAEPLPEVLSNPAGPIVPPSKTSRREVNDVMMATPLRRWGGADEIAKAVLFLLDSDFVTGECIRVDGGRHLI
jgi:outer membrane protein TolC